MRRRSAGLDTLGEVDVLTVDECHAATSAVLALREHWAFRSPSHKFATLGVNAYMDLASSPDPLVSYDGRLATHNRLLREHFGPLYDRLAAVLEDELSLPVRYADDLALPGFHLWLAEAIPRRAEASTHFDLQYERVLTRPQYSASTGTVSFTLPIALPASGASLDVWPGCSYPTSTAVAEYARTHDPETVRYRLGKALLHSGHVLHRVGATPDATADDRRIMLQGHGLIVDQTVFLYW